MPANFLYFTICCFFSVFCFDLCRPSSCICVCGCRRSWAWFSAKNQGSPAQFAQFCLSNETGALFIHFSQYLFHSHNSYFWNIRWFAEIHSSYYFCMSNFSNQNCGSCSFLQILWNSIFQDFGHFLSPFFHIIPENHHFSIEVMNSY